MVEAFLQHRAEQWGEVGRARRDERDPRPDGARQFLHAGAELHPVLRLGLAALLAPPSHVHSRSVKSSQLALPLLFGALVPRAEAFELPNRDDVEEDGSDRRLGEAGSCDAGCDGYCNGSCDHCYGCDLWLPFVGWTHCDHNCAPQR